MSTVQRGRPPEHGQRATPAYRAWAYIRRRATPSTQQWRPGELPAHSHDPHWSEFRGFLEDMGECPEGHALRRQDASKGFDVTNCVWAPQRRKEG